MRSEHRLERAQSWEDPHLLRTALQPVPDDHGLCLAGAGESAFSLASAGSLLAFDPSFPQIALCSLKATAHRLLPIQSVRSFLGLGHFGRRVWFYHYLRESLPVEVRRYWDAREELIRSGLLQAGAWEQEFAAFRRQLHWFRSPKEVELLLAPRSLEEQARFYKDHWDGLRWRLLLAHYSRRLGLPLQQRLEERLPLQPLSENFLLRQALTGEFGDLESGYPSLSVAGHSLAGELRLECGELETVLQRQKSETFSFAFLGDLLVEDRERKLKTLHRVLRPGARVLWWGTRQPCPLPDSLRGHFQEVEGNWIHQDRILIRASVHLAIRSPER